MENVSSLGCCGLLTNPKVALYFDTQGLACPVSPDAWLLSLSWSPRVPLGLPASQPNRPILKLERMWRNERREGGEGGREMMRPAISLSEYLTKRKLVKSYHQSEILLGLARPHTHTHTQLLSRDSSDVFHCKHLPPQCMCVCACVFVVC